MGKGDVFMPSTTFIDYHVLGIGEKLKTDMAPDLNDVYSLNNDTGKLFQQLDGGNTAAP